MNRETTLERMSRLNPDLWKAWTTPFLRGQPVKEEEEPKASEVAFHAAPVGSATGAPRR